MSGIGLPDRHVRCGVVALAAAMLLTTVVACSGDDAESLATLPPIRTTTSSSTTTTVVDERTVLYTVKPGDNLSVIANSFEVPLAFLIEENADQIDDPNNVPPGVTLRIPPYRIVEELPTTVSSTQAPSSVSAP